MDKERSQEALSKEFEQRVEHGYMLNLQLRQEDADYLAKVIGVDWHWVQNADDHVIFALCGTILINHLSEYDQVIAMKDIHDLRTVRPQLWAELVGKVDEIYINKVFGNEDNDAWSMTTKELENKINCDKRISKYLGWLGFAGVGVSIPTIYTVIKESIEVTKIKNPYLIGAGFLALVITVSTNRNEKILEKEVMRRQPAPHKM